MCLQRIRCDEIFPSLGSGVRRGEELDALADSIRAHGVLRPVLVRATPSGYAIVHGERRWRAARMVGLKEIPALVVQDILSCDSTLPQLEGRHLAERAL